MILLRRLNNAVIGLNADLIERIDATPDTVITLVDGKKYVVAETPTEVVERIVEFRANVLANAGIQGSLNVPVVSPPNDVGARQLRLVSDTSSATAADETPTPGEPGGDGRGAQPHRRAEVRALQADGASASEPGGDGRGAQPHRRN